MEINNLFFFDIETCGKYKDFNEFKKNDLEGSELFIKKIEKKINKKDLEWSGDFNKDYIKFSPLICEYGKIICISCGYIKDNELKIFSFINNDEKIILENAHKIFKKIDSLELKLCGYNIKGFDIPWIFKKLCINNLEVPICINTFNKKPWEINSLDLAELWKSTNWEMSGFNEVTYSLNIESPKDEIDGTMVHKTYWEDKNLELIKNYCEKDVKALYNICKKLENLI